MIARVDGAEDLSIHRTYLRPDGSGKITYLPAKMMLGPTAGGAVRMKWGDGDGCLVVAEGIETALSLANGLMSGFGPIWAALSAQGMACLKLPSTPGSLIIATDGDKAGRDAGQILAKRARTLGWTVTIHPAPDSADWNDVLVRGGVDR